MALSFLEVRKHHNEFPQATNPEREDFKIDRHQIHDGVCPLYCFL